jgi:DNA-directed RNA polymerase sigma subunit (sigma70/sigma32)
MPNSIGPVRIKAIELKKQNPDLTLEQIAKQCGVTKQRIHKIFQDEGIPRRPLKHLKEGIKYVGGVRE